MELEIGEAVVYTRRHQHWLDKADQWPAHLWRMDHIGVVTAIEGGLVRVLWHSTWGRPCGAAEQLHFADNLQSHSQKSVRLRR